MQLRSNEKPTKTERPDTLKFDNQTLKLLLSGAIYSLTLQNCKIDVYNANEYKGYQSCKKCSKFSVGFESPHSSRLGSARARVRLVYRKEKRKCSRWLSIESELETLVRF